MNVVQDALVPTDENTVCVSPGEIERVNVPVFLIEQPESLSGLVACNDLRSRTLTISGQPYGMVRRAGSLWQQRTVAFGPAAKLNHVAGREDCGVRFLQAVPCRLW